METQSHTYPLYAKVLHIGMAVFGIAAFSTGEFAEGGVNSLGYLLHAYLGLSLATFMLLRIVPGVAWSGPLRFSGWSPFSRRQWAAASQDLRSLLQLKIPDRGMHEGLAGLTQAFGLLIFGWMALTGTGLFLLAGGAEGALFGVVEEVHEIGEALIPLYLTLHIGSVIAHSMVGNPIWKRMWKFRESPGQGPTNPVEGRRNLV
jgi:cytochrome b561